MMTLTSTKKNTATDKFVCPFCNKEFVRETSLAKHMCEPKRRWEARDNPNNITAFRLWLEFHTKHMVSSKPKTYRDFTKSSYYTVFVKFVNYCSDIRAINTNFYFNWLIDNKIRVDEWAKDTNYNKFLISYLKTENYLDALSRSIETMIGLAKIEGIQTNDYFRYGNRNKICHNVVNGKISPWVLYHSESGIKFLESVDSSQQKMILDYIDPEPWAARFKRYPETVTQVKELLKKAGY